MKPVDQIKVSIVDGDCASAVLASLLELPVRHVPNFHNDKDGFLRGVIKFMRGQGWEFLGCRIPDNFTLKDGGDINGYFYASVPSATFDGYIHAVVMDMKGLVAHDPNPNKAWLGKQIYPEKLFSCYTFEKIYKSPGIKITK